MIFLPLVLGKVDEDSPGKEREREGEKENAVRKQSSLPDTCRPAAGCLAGLRQSNYMFLKRVGQAEIENQVGLTLHSRRQTDSK